MWIIKFHFFKLNQEPRNPEVGSREIASDNYNFGIDKNYVFRNKRSTLKNASEPQSTPLCTGFGVQPCTCYYPDHPNVPLFQLDTDVITRNASNVNGTGPETCEDLQVLNYNLPGFHMVRFKPNRVKTIFCAFNQTAKNDLNSKIQSDEQMFSLEQNALKVPEMFKFCNGPGSQPCTFLYPDYPDISLFNPRINKTTYNRSCGKNNCHTKEPASCEDLSLNGHKLQGFYAIRLNARKVKIVYCYFDQIIKNNKSNTRIKRSMLLKNSGTKSSNYKPVCNGAGSRPCSCYNTNSQDVLQFELSDDDVTRAASSDNSTVLSNCEELQHVGHTLDGFYMVRDNSFVIKIVYCIYNQIRKENYDPVTLGRSTTTIQPTTLNSTGKIKIFNFLLNCRLSRYL